MTMKYKSSGRGYTVHKGDVSSFSPSLQNKRTAKYSKIYVKENSNFQKLENDERKVVRAHHRLINKHHQGVKRASEERRKHDLEILHALSDKKTK